MSCHDELIRIACLIELSVHYTECSLLSSTAGYTTVSALVVLSQSLLVEFDDNTSTTFPEIIASIIKLLSICLKIQRKGGTE